jgi:hypothetical protein
LLTLKEEIIPHPANSIGYITAPILMKIREKRKLFGKTFVNEQYYSSNITFRVSSATQYVKKQIG